LQPAERLTSIDLAELSALCGFAEVAHFQRAHRQWVANARTHNAVAGDDRWLQAIAVGGRAFVDKVQVALGIKAKHREVGGADGHSTLLLIRGLGFWCVSVPHFSLRRRNAARPARPKASSARVAGSGTACASGSARKPPTLKAGATLSEENPLLAMVCVQAWMLMMVGIEGRFAREEQVV